MLCFHLRKNNFHFTTGFPLNSKHPKLNGRFVYASKIQSGILETLSITKHLFLKNYFILPQVKEKSQGTETVLLSLGKI